MEEMRPCRMCQNQFPEDHVIPYEDGWICGSCKNIYFQKVQEGIEPTFQGQYELAGFGIRVLAKIIDGILLSIVIYGTLFAFLFAFGFGMEEELFSATGQPSGGEIIFTLVFYLFSALVPCAYDTYMVGRFRATLGKMLLGLEVVRSDGEGLTYARAFGRYWGTVLSYMICWIGYIMAAFDDQNRALHDQLADTRVIRT